MILKKEIIENLSRELLLPYTGIEQDWDIEMADSNRIDEFIAFYKRGDLSDELKLATMSLILTSYEDYLGINELGNNRHWEEIKSQLKAEKILFKDLIRYWSIGEEAENLFRITSLIREIKIID